MAAGILTVGLTSAAPAADTQDNPWLPLYADVMHYSASTGAQVNLADQATVRLKGDLLYIDDMPTARKVLAYMGVPIPDDMIGLLRIPDTPDALGGLLWAPVRFVRSGGIKADEALAFTQDDMLASLRATIERKRKDNPSLPATEVRRWVWPPHYDPEKHTMTYAALFLPPGSPATADGPVVFHGLAFGREGYIEVSMTAGLERAPRAQKAVTDFLAGLTFNNGKGVDPLGRTGAATTSLADAMNMDGFRKAPMVMPSVFADKLVPLVGGGLSIVALLALAFSAYRYRRRDARRW